MNDTFSDEEIIYEDVPNKKQNVIAVKEYSPVPEDTDEADLVFIHVNGTVASSWLKHKNYIHASIITALPKLRNKF